LDGVDEKLRAGAKVADVGCGQGASTILMAEAFPRSTFLGFDYHPGSIEAARERAAAGLSDRVTFVVADATQYPGQGYDFVAHFDCLHDMGDPTGAAQHVRETLADDGTWMIVEPFAGDTIEENLNPVGRVYYGASTLLCVLSSLAHDGPALGAQGGRRDSAKWWRPAGSPASAEPRRRHSIWCSKRVCRSRGRRPPHALSRDGADAGGGVGHTHSAAGRPRRCTRTAGTHSAGSSRSPGS
jgi:SAM-dependent methyltransferase